MSEEVNGVGLGLGRDNPAILKRRALKFQGFKASPKLQAPVKSPDSNLHTRRVTLLDCCYPKFMTTREQIRVCHALARPKTTIGLRMLRPRKTGLFSKMIMGGYDTAR
jgi:hypothetical protein